MKDISQKVIEAAEKSGATVIGMEANQQLTKIKLRADSVLFFEVIVNTSSTMEEIKLEIVDKYYRTKGIK